MANNTLNTRIVLCNDTSVNWGSSSKVLLKGELGIELTDGVAPKIKIGDGVNAYADLKYVTMTPAEIASAINTAVENAKHTHSNKSILDSITAAFTTSLKTNYDKAYTHSTTAHAPSNAQANIIESVKVNGTALTPSDKAVNITVPTKTSQLTNDSGYKTTDNNTTYSLDATASATNGNAKINLTGSDSSTKSVTIKGSGATTVTTDASGIVTVSSTNTVYTHPNSGVTAGTYKSVTVNAQGHVTGGTNPTTLAGYGITDAAAKSHTHGNADITSLDASKLTSGTIDIARLPQGALERCVIVADDTARFALTKSSVQTGDTVKVTSTGKMYFIVDDTKLNVEAGYEVYTAGSATSVPWSGVTDKPSSYTPSAHNHDITSLTGFGQYVYNATISRTANTVLAAPNGSNGVATFRALTAADIPTLTKSKISDFPSSLPASDVYSWAKASTKPSYTKSEVGLGNVDNTADANKSVKYATSAGSASSATTATTASKLGTNAGASNRPVYFSGGVPVAANVSTDYLTQGANTIILDGGTATA